MSVVLICRQCGYAQRCFFDIHGSAYAIVSGCTQQCRGCGRMLGVPDMHTTGAGQLTLINRDPAVVAIVANVVSQFARTGTFSVTEYEYDRLPQWAKALLDIARNHPKLSGVALAALGFLMGQMIDLGHMALDNHMSHKSALLLQDRQFQHELDILVAANQPGNIVRPPLGSRVPELWTELLNRVRVSYSKLDGLRDGREVSDSELQQYIDNYNNDLDFLYRVLAEDRHRLGLLPSAHVEPDLSGLSLEPPLVEVKRQGRNSPCKCGSGRKFKKCCGVPQVR